MSDTKPIHVTKTVRPGDMIVFKLGNQSIVIRRRRSAHYNRVEIQMPATARFHIIRQPQKGQPR